MYRFLQRTEEGVRVPGAEVTDDDELPDMGGRVLPSLATEFNSQDPHGREEMSLTGFI